MNTNLWKAAHIIYDDNPEDMMCIHGAKHELTQQIFTKTMNVQVWKPDFERPGRHFVYTTRYVQFFVKLLFSTADKSGLEALARKVRKKQGEFVNHTLLWHELCIANLRVGILFHSSENSALTFVANSIPRPNTRRS